jgi:hypothetical protein
MQEKKRENVRELSQKERETSSKDFVATFNMNRDKSSQDLFQLMLFF